MLMFQKYYSKKLELVKKKKKKTQNLFQSILYTETLTPKSYILDLVYFFLLHPLAN